MPADTPGMSPDFLAALGFISVFAAAANTPFACVIMDAEIFGTSGIIHFGITVFVAARSPAIAGSITPSGS